VVVARRSFGGGEFLSSPKKLLSLVSSSLIRTEVVQVEVVAF
jgi:hypothetical protein